MADFATESANKGQPAHTISGNAPPTPPETQELKSADPTPKISAPTTASPGAGSVPQHQDSVATPATKPVESAEDPGTSTAATTTDAPAPPTDSTPKSAESQADHLTTQPEKPSEEVSTPGPINAEASTVTVPATEDKPKLSPKPVSVEDVRDADELGVTPTVVNESTKPETSVTDIAPAASEPVSPPSALAVTKDPKDTKDTKDAGDTNMTEAQPSVATGPESPKSVPAIPEPAASEPKTGQKRKAEEPATVNGVLDSDAQESTAPAEKKHKSSPLKKAINKVASTVKGVGRSKKEKRELAPVGRTARKTRSQGKADEI